MNDITREVEPASVSLKLKSLVGVCVWIACTGQACSAPSEPAEASEYSLEGPGRDGGETPRGSVQKGDQKPGASGPLARRRTRGAMAVQEQLGTPEAPRSDVIAAIDDNGRSIRPDWESARDKRSRGFAARGAAAPNELTFTFDSPDEPWSEDELTSVREWTGACYKVIRTLYGPPAFSNTVNVRKATSGSFAGGYSPSTNEILVNSFNGAVLCHEIVHAFHDDLVLGLASWEEGMARAVEVEACKRAGIPSGNAHDYGYDVYYENLNQPAVGAIAGNIFAGWAQVLLRYQLAGYAWAKPMLEDNEFFVRFNRLLYESAATDASITADEVRLLELAAQAKRSVENLPFPTWKSNQHILDTDPPTGDILYMRTTDSDGLVVTLLNRQPSGGETNLAGVEVQWTVSDHSGSILGSGTQTTTPLGWMEVDDLGIINYWANHNYNGRLKITASAVVDSTRLEATAYTKASPGTGVFGVVVGADTGTLVLTPLDSDSSAISATVSDGSFQAEGLLQVKGRFQYEFVTTGGRRSRPVVFTKDDTSYFLLVEYMPEIGCDYPGDCCKRPHGHCTHHRCNWGHRSCADHRFRK